MAARCAAEGVDHPEHLFRLVELELIDRYQRMVERRIRAARFPAVKSLDTFDFPPIPSVNKSLVMELARCEYVQRRENVIAIGNSGTGKTHVALGLGLAACQKGMSVGFTTAALVHEQVEARDERRLLNLQRQAVPAQPANHRRPGLRAPVPDRCGAALRGLQPALRAQLHPGHHQSALRRVDPGVRLRASYRSIAGPADPPRPHPGDERRELSPQAQPAERCLAAVSRRAQRPLVHQSTPTPGRTPPAGHAASLVQPARHHAGGPVSRRHSGTFSRRH